MKGTRGIHVFYCGRISQRENGNISLKLFLVSTVQLLSIANLQTLWMTPDIQDILDRQCFLRQIPSLEIASNEPLSHDVWRSMTVLVIPV